MEHFVVWILFLFFAGMSVYGVAVSFYMYFKERRIWNNGICRETGQRWEFIGFDDEYGLLYKSFSLEHRTREIYGFNWYIPRPDRKH